MRLRSVFLSACVSAAGCGKVPPPSADPTPFAGTPDGGTERDDAAIAPEIPTGSTSTVACAELPKLASPRTSTVTIHRARNKTVAWYSVIGACRRDAELSRFTIVLEREARAGSRRWVPFTIDDFFPEVFFLWVEVRPGEFANLDFGHFAVRGAMIGGALLIPPDGAPLGIPARAVRRVLLAGKIGRIVPEGRYRFITGLHRVRMEGREHVLTSSAVGPMLVLGPQSR